MPVKTDSIQPETNVVPTKLISTGILEGTHLGHLSTHYLHTQVLNGGMILDGNNLYGLIIKAFNVSLSTYTQGVKPASHAGFPASET